MKIAAMQQAAPAQTKQAKASRETERSNPFSAQLSRASAKNSQSKEQVQDSSVKSKEDTAAGKDLNTTVEEMIRGLEDILEELSIEAGYVNAGFLESKDMQALLNNLPQELSQKLQSLFQNNLTMEGILESVKSWDSKDKFLAVLMAMTQLEKQAGIEESSAQKQFLKMMEEMKGQLQLPKGQEVKSMAELVQALTKQAVKQDKNILQLLENAAVKNTQKDTHLLFANVRSVGVPVMASKQGSQQNNHSSNQQDSSQAGKQMVDAMISRSDQNIQGSSEQTQTKLQHVIQLNSNQPKPMQQQFIEQFQKIIQKSQFTSFANGNAQLTLKLNPEHLGTLSIKLIQTNGEMAARIIASTQSAKDLIESNLHQLRHLFAGQNVQVEKFEVNIQNQQQYQMFKDNQDNGKHNEQQEKQSEGNDEEAQSFAESFEEELLNLMA